LKRPAPSLCDFGFDNLKTALEKLSGRHIIIKTLIMQNLGVFFNHNERIKTFSPLLIFFRQQRCCYQAFSGHMPAMIYAQMHYSELKDVMYALRRENKKETVLLS